VFVDFTSKFVEVAEVVLVFGVYAPLFVVPQFGKFNDITYSETNRK